MTCVFLFSISIGYKISDFGELQVPDIKSHNYILNNTLVKNSLECGAVAEKVSELTYTLQLDD